ncbi:MAG: putative Holliday junction resolvase [Parcubacteria group bacterium ADurb.Bin159]|nr:MAG: putative Holliday junction resolvase [Parcubacteria group bacterium ADurb.Bin159]
MENNFLGVDFGEKFVGLAIAKEPLFIAFPYKTLEYKNKKELINQLLEIIKENSISQIIIGWPVSLSNKSTKQTKKTQKFIQEFKKYIKIPILTTDERLTSRGLSKESHSSSAALILERGIKKCQI